MRRRRSVLAILALGLSCRDEQRTGLDFEIVLDAQSLPYLEEVQVILDVPGGFRPGPRHVEEMGTIETTVQDLDGDSQLEALVSFRSGYQFKPVLRFVLQTDSHDELETKIRALAFRATHQLMAVADASATITPGRSPPVQVRLGCACSTCSPIPIPAPADLGAPPPSLRIVSSNEPRSATSCDLDDDGREDIVIGVPFEPSTLLEPAAGAVYVLFSRAWKDAARPTKFDLAYDNIDDLVVHGRAGGDQLGLAVACGDVNGDGIADLIVGAPHSSGIGGTDDTGAVKVFFGDRGLRNSVVDLAPGGGGTPDIEIDGVASGDQVGSSVLAADLDGDGVAELAVAAPGQRAPAGGAEAGAVHVWRGRSAWPSGLLSADASALDHVVVTGGPGMMIPSAMAAGDLDRDGKRELVLGVTRETTQPSQAPRGAVFVLRALDTAWDARYDLAAPGTSILAIRPDSDGTGFGSAVALGDFTGDGDPDLIVGAPLDQGLSGAVYFVRGGAGVFEAPVVQLTTSSRYLGRLRGANAGDLFGTALATVASGDKTIVDLVVGAPGGGLSCRMGAGLAYWLRAHALSGGIDLSLSEADTFGASDVLMVGATDAAALGDVVAAGHFNTEDTIGDVLIVAPIARSSHVLFGTP